MSITITTAGTAPSILWDAIAGRFRCWLLVPSGNGYALGHCDSLDGLSWTTPVIVRPYDGVTVKWGATVVDTGVPGPTRFRNAYWTEGVGYDGIHIDASPDGLTWSLFGSPQSLVPPHTHSDDIVDLWRDPVDGQWGMFLKRWTDPVNKLNNPDARRHTWVSRSSDCLSWSTPTPAFWTDGLDHPGVQFYGCAGPLLINNMRVAFLRVLRDDVLRGIGYTVLAWSQDGVNWNRNRTPFLVGDPFQADEAMAWVTGSVVRNQLVYLGIAAYRDGHKVGPRIAQLVTVPLSEFTADALEVSVR